LTSYPEAEDGSSKVNVGAPPSTRIGVVQNEERVMDRVSSEPVDAIVLSRAWQR
jgi:hypothetical protein